MERNIKKIGFVNLIVLLGVGVASLLVARYTNSLAGQAGTVYMGLGFLVIAIGYFQMRLEETERLERLEFDELNKTAGTASLFNTAETEVFPAKRSREQFERYFVPGFTVLLFGLQAGGAYLLWKWLSKLTPGPLNQPTLAMSLFGLFALTLFLLGKYAVGLTRLKEARLLRPGASYLLLGAYVCFVITGCIAAVVLGFPRVDYYAAQALLGVLGLVAAETLINLILEIYRPRVAGKVGRVLYDSRLVGLLAEPEGLFTTAAHALDYQFGFKVSETWFYRFLQKALVWLVLMQVSVLFLSTSFVFVSPGDQGLLERFGRPVADGRVLEPGLHLKLPWPIDQVHRFRTREIQSFNVGFVPDEDEAHEHAVLWTGKHYKEEANWLIASRQTRSLIGTNEASADRGIPADLINVSVPVQFQIKDLQAWAYNHTDAAKLLERVATREVVRYLAGRDLLELMATGRTEAAEELNNESSSKNTNFDWVSEVWFRRLAGFALRPRRPFEVQRNPLATFRKHKVYDAEGYLSKQCLLGADAERKLNESHAYSNRKILTAVAEAGQFTNQMTAYQSSPRVYAERAYLLAMERGMTNSRKYVMATTNTHDILQFNLEDKLRGELINDITMPSSRK